MFSRDSVANKNASMYPTTISTGGMFTSLINTTQNKITI